MAKPKGQASNGDGPEELTIEEKQTKVCELFSRGWSFRRINDLKIYGSDETIRQWILKDPAFAGQYARAKQIWRDTRFEEMEEVILAPLPEDPLWAKIRLEQRRQQIDARKWQLSKEEPKKYGKLAEEAAKEEPQKPDEDETPSSDLPQDKLIERIQRKLG